MYQQMPCKGYSVWKYDKEQKSICKSIGMMNWKGIISEKQAFIRVDEVNKKSFELNYNGGT